MPLPTTREELISRLQDAWRKLDAELDDLPTDDGRRTAASKARAARATGVDGELCVCDLIAFQLGWGRLLLGWEVSEMVQEIPEMPAAGFKWNQQKALAQTFYDKHAKWSLNRLRREFELLVDQCVRWIGTLSDDELFQTGHRDWAGEKWPIVKWIQVNTIAPYGSARTKIRRWKRERIKENNAAGL